MLHRGVNKKRTKTLGVAAIGALGVRRQVGKLEDEMNAQPCVPDEAFARDLAELDRELAARTDPEMPEKAVNLLAGLVAGMALVGRPSR